MQIIPAFIGLALWAGATCLLISDVVIDGHAFTLSHALQPCLTAATVASAVYAHHRLASLRLMSGVAMLALAMLGSLATVYGTLSRTAATRDAQAAEAMAENRTLRLNEGELATARDDAKRECRSGFGPKCAKAKARVDALVATMSSLRVVSIDPRADALGKLADLIGLDGRRTREIVSVLDPVILPLFLELGSLVFFSVAFPHRRKRQETVSTTATVAQSFPATERKTFTRSQAFDDFRSLKNSNSQQFLAERWQVSPGTVSKWMKDWETGDHIRRSRDGKSKAIAVIRSPRKLLAKA